MTAALVGGGVAASVLGATGPASAAEPESGVGVDAHVGDVASVSVQVQTPEVPGDDEPDDPGDGTPPPPTEPPPTDPPPTDEPTEPPEDDEPTTPPTEPPSEDPTTPPTDEPTEPPSGDPGGGTGSDDGQPPSGGVGDDRGTSPDGPDSGGCEGDALSCTEDVPAPETQPEAAAPQQGRAVPAEAQSGAGDGDALADTGADDLGRLGLLGAGLVGAGGVMTMRHYRGRHRRAG
jgi:hypothetical protein